MIARVRRPLIAIACLTFACVRYVPRPVDAAATAQALRTRQPDWPASGPLMLASLTETAWRLNPEIALARAQYESAVAAIATSREWPNPVLNASLQRKNSDPGVLSPWVSNFGIDLPLDLPSKRAARAGMARENAYAALARVGSIGWQVRSRLWSNMLDLYAASQREIALKHEESLQADIAELFEKRVQLGEAAHPDLSRARIALRQITLLIADTERQANVARAGIAAAVGVPESAIPADRLFQSDVLREPNLDPSLRDAALTARPDIIAALHDYAAADAALRLEVARQFPDIHVAPAFGWDQGTRTWTLGGLSEVPVLNRHRGAIGEASARRDEAAARLVAQQAAIIAEYEAARATVLGAQKKNEEAKRLLDDVTHQLETTQRQFDAGEIDRLALRSAELEVDAARLAALDAMVDLQRSVGALEDAIQQPLQQTTTGAKP